MQQQTFEKYFREILESLPDAIMLIDSSGKIVLANTQAATMFGYSSDELMEHSIEDFLPHRFAATHASHREQYFLSPHIRTIGSGMELYGCRRDRSEFPIEISLSPVTTDQGTFVVSALRDITKRKEEEELRRTELQEQSRRIQEATRLKSEFLANMSHELRTPLNGIIGFSEFLADEKPGTLNEKQKEYINDILLSGKHLLHLLNDVLDIAKIEAGKIEFIAREFSLSRTIEEVCSVLHPAIVKKNISLSVTLSPMFDSVVLDQQKFKQVLYNLLSNAVKFTNNGGNVSVTTQPWKLNSFLLQVKDNGIGIRKEDVHKLFKEFQQIDSGTNKQYEGTGLGLAITKKFVELQNGVIQVESEFGKGSVFSVVLPLKYGELIQ